MSYEFYSNREIKKTRKDHRCDCCNILIPAGSSAQYQSGKYDGDFCAGYTCGYCETWIKNNRSKFDCYEFSYDEVMDLMWEDAREKCKTCADYDSEIEECSRDDEPMNRGRCDEYKEVPRNANE